MAGVKLTGDWSQLEGKLHNIAATNFTALHENIGEYMVSSIQDRFDSETDPQGQRWPQSRRARMEGGQTLSDTGTLRNSFTHRARADRADIGTMDKRASVHQKGATIRPKNKRHLKFKVGDRWVTTSRVKMPKRQMVGISAQDSTEILNIIKDSLEGK